MKTRRHVSTALAILSLCALAAAPAPADLIKFDGETNNTWETGTNWFPDTVPGPADDAVVDTSIKSGSNLTVTLSSDAGTVNSLQVGGGTNQTTLNLNNALSNLVVATTFTIGGVDPSNPSTQRVGNLTVGSNNAATMTVSGDIVSGSTSDNDITINTNASGFFNLAGSIDPGGLHETDLTLQRGNLNLTGLGAQILNVEEFNVNDSGNNNSDAVLTLAAGKTLAATGVSDIARNTAGASANRNLTGTLNLYGGTAIFGNDLRVGSVSNGNTNDAQGTVNVGDATNAAILTVDGVLRLGIGQDADDGQARQTTGTLSVDHADSLVTLNTIELAPNEVNPNTAGSINIAGGLVRQVSGDIITGAGTGTINLNGGTLDLAATGSAIRSVTSYSQADGATLKLTVHGGMVPLTAANMTLAPAQTDIEIVHPAGFASTVTQVTWVGGTGIWDTTVTNWDADPPNGQYILPADAAGVIETGDQIAILQSPNEIVNYGNGALTGPGGWTLDETDPARQVVKVVRIGAPLGFGPAVAVINDAASLVTRDSDLSIQAEVGADASGIDISAGSLTLAGTSNLVLGGIAQGNVNQSGGAVAIGGDLRFGTGLSTEGGTYHITGGTLDVGGVVEEVADSVNNGYLFIDVPAGNVTIAGDVRIQSFRVGEGPGNTGEYVVGAGQTITGTGSTGIVIGNNGTGVLTQTTGAVNSENQLVLGMGSSASSGTWNISGGTSSIATNLRIGDNGTGVVNVSGNAAVGILSGELRIASSPGGVGTLTLADTATIDVTGGNTEVSSQGSSTASGNGTLIITGGTFTQNTSNLVLGQDQNTDPTTVFTMTGGVLDLRPAYTANGGEGQINMNDGVVTAVISGTAVVYANSFQLMDDNAGAVTLTIGDGSGGTPLVYVNNDLEYRNGGTDTVDLRSGTLAFGSGPGNAVNAGAAGNNAFNWTGGTIRGLEAFNGLDLVQGNSDADSLLEVGSSAGTMSTTGSYLLAAAGANASTLEIEVFARDVNPGVDFDQLTVGGTADLLGTVRVLDQSGGAISTNVAFAWDVIVADVINAGTVWDLPEGFHYRIVGDGQVGGGTDVLQIYTVPEPGTLVLLVVAALSSLTVLRRRRAA